MEKQQREENDYKIFQIHAGRDMFYNCPLSAIKVPAGSVSACQAAAGRSTYSNKIVSQ